MIVEGQVPKGDAFAVARVAGIMAAKKTADLIPLCHPLAITMRASISSPSVTAYESAPQWRRTTSRVSRWRPLTAAGVAALTLYDMCKAVDRGMTVDGLGLLLKEGWEVGSVDPGRGPVDDDAARPGSSPIGQPEREEDGAQDAR